MTDPYKWLTDFFETRRVQSPLSVEFIIPRVFERYFIIQDNYGIMDDYPFHDLPNGASEQEQEIRYNEERRFVLLLRNSFNPTSLYRKASLKELSERFHLDYNIDLPDHLKGPGISVLRDRTLENIGSLIHLLKKNEPLWLYVPDYFRFNYDVKNKENYIKEKNTIEDIDDYIEFQGKSNLDSCSYLFPLDCSWCLATFEDLSTFIFVSDKNSAEELSKIKELEYFEVSENYKSPNDFFMK